MSLETGEILNLFIHANRNMNRPRDYGFIVYALAHFMDNHKDKANDFKLYKVVNWIQTKCIKDEKSGNEPDFIALLNLLDLEKKEYEEYHRVMTNIKNNQYYYKPTVYSEKLLIIQEDIPSIIEHIEKSYHVEKCLQYDKVNKIFKWISLGYNNFDIAKTNNNKFINILPMDFIYIHEMIDERLIKTDGSIEVIKKRKIQALRDEIDEMTFRYNPKTDERGTAYNNFQVKVIDTKVPLHERKIEPRIDVNVPESILYKILFKPPLTEGMWVEFTTEETFNGLHIMYYEDLEELYKEGKIQLPDLDERSTTRISYPMKKLYRKITFEPGYYIQNARCNAAMQRIKIHEEANRIKNYFSFTPATKKKGAVIELTVENPIRDMQYEIYWTPPRRNPSKEKS